MKEKISRVEINTEIWLPEASRFGNLLGSNNIKYAIFGAGTLAVHNVMIRPTIDIDFVVNDYEKAVTLLKEQSELASTDLQKERDGIQVADFYFKSGITVQIWDDNMYSLPMTEESWSRIVFKPVAGYSSIWSISMEDLIVSKIGRYTQQKSESEYEANKNARDIVATIQTLDKPNFNYVLKRLGEGARRESLSKFSAVHNLNWYFVKEVETYREMSETMDAEKIGKFIASVLVKSKSPSTEYWLLHNLRKGQSIKKFKLDFMLDEKSCSVLLQRWKSILSIDGDKVSIPARKIQEYIKSLKPEELSEYAKRLVFSGKQKH